jgi:hypothetical protein
MFLRNFSIIIPDYTSLRPSRLLCNVLYENEELG